MATQFGSSAGHSRESRYANHSVPPNATGMQMVVPKLVGVYATYGKVFDDFDRKPYDISGGASYWPSGTRSWRLNLHLIHVRKSPAASNFGFYTAGQTGTTISAGVDILL